MTDVEVKAGLDDWQALALTIYGEARGDASEGGTSVEERIAVGCVVRNRLATPARFGDTYRAVCLARSQFSCWWLFGGADNYAHLLGLARMILKVDPMPTLYPHELGLLMESQYLAEGIIGGQLIDSVRGSTHYYAPMAMKPIGSVPDWAAKNTLLAHVGNHLFFRA